MIGKQEEYILHSLNCSVDQQEIPSFLECSIAEGNHAAVLEYMMQEEKLSQSVMIKALSFAFYQKKYINEIVYTKIFFDLLTEAEKIDKILFDRFALSLCVRVAGGNYNLLEKLLVRKKLNPNCIVNACSEKISRCEKRKKILRLVHTLNIGNQLNAHSVFTLIVRTCCLVVDRTLFHILICRLCEQNAISHNPNHIMHRWSFLSMLVGADYPENSHENVLFFLRKHFKCRDLAWRPQFLGKYQRGIVSHKNFRHTQQFAHMDTRDKQDVIKKARRRRDHPLLESRKIWGEIVQLLEKL